MGGYLDFYIMRGWYDNLPQDIRDYLYKSCGYGVNTSSDRLLTGDVYRLQSATSFLCGHAFNALHDRHHAACDAFMEKALCLCLSDDDKEIFTTFSARIAQERPNYPDQKEIDRYVPIVFDLIKSHPGILQAHLKKHFPAHLEVTIGRAYWVICQSGKVRREKKGSSFQLYIVKPEDATI